MELNFEQTKEAFDKYVEECRKKIKDTFFSEDYLRKNQTIKKNLVDKGLILPETSLSDSIKQKRLLMIEQKVDHTMRIVEDVSAMSNKLGVNIDFNKVLKVAALMHDIGRFDQATKNNDYADGPSYQNVKGISNHAHAGYHILFDKNLSGNHTNGVDPEYLQSKIDNFEIDSRLYPAIGSVVYNHGNPILTGDLDLKLKNINSLNVEQLTGNYILNDSEKIIVAALVQMVRDVDMLDILYQNLTGEFPLIREDIAHHIKPYDTLENISKRWGISVEEILEYNEISREEFKNMIDIKIPVKNMKKSKLVVPQDIQTRFFRNEDIDLVELRKRSDYSFIVGMWWRLNHFLNNISFTSNLQLIHEKDLLQQIYNEYPDEYKFLVKDAFEFAEEHLVTKILAQSNDEIYINRNK